MTQIVKDLIKFVIHTITAEQIAQTIICHVIWMKIVMTKTKFADQLAVKMMIVGVWVSYVIKARDFVSLVIFT